MHSLLTGISYYAYMGVVSDLIYYQVNNISYLFFYMDFRA